MIRGGPSLMGRAWPAPHAPSPRTHPATCSSTRPASPATPAGALAPATFGGGEDERAFVARQPGGPAERRRALLALVACPVAAIGSRSKDGRRARRPARSRTRSPRASSAAATRRSRRSARRRGSSCRPDGNVLVDSPRFSAPLLERIRALGGARLMFLTHRDDVADHARWREALGLRAGAARARRRRRDAGRGASARGRRAGPARARPRSPSRCRATRPGRARSSSTTRYLFTGDHLWGDAAGRLGASRAVCWWDWDAQIASMERLAAHRFEWVLPGHGRPWRAPSPDQAAAEVRALARAMRDGDQRGERREAQEPARVERREAQEPEPRSGARGASSAGVPFRTPSSAATEPARDRPGSCAESQAEVRGAEPLPRAVLAQLAASRAPRSARGRATSSVKPSGTRRSGMRSSGETT